MVARARCAVSSFDLQVSSPKRGRVERLNIKLVGAWFENRAEVDDSREVPWLPRGFRSQVKNFFIIYRDIGFVIINPELNC